MEEKIRLEGNICSLREGVGGGRRDRDSGLRLREGRRGERKMIMIMEIEGGSGRVRSLEEEDGGGMGKCLMEKRERGKFGIPPQGDWDGKGKWKGKERV